MSKKFSEKERIIPFFFLQRAIQGKLTRTEPESYQTNGNKEDMKQEINRHEILEKITPLIENTAMRFDLIPIEIDFSKENHRWFLRIFLYSHKRSITLDDCENVTRSLNDFLDEIIPVKYYLEVSSPGLERKFKSEKEFEIFKGKRVSIKLKQPLEGETERIFKGEIVDWDYTHGLTFFRFDDAQELKIPKENIQSAKLYVD